MISFNEAKSIVIKEITKSGYNFKEINSKTTDSVYYEISSDSASLLFRISNHSTYKNIITFRVDHKNDREKLVKFIKNRINDLSYRTTKAILGI